MHECVLDRTRQDKTGVQVQERRARPLLEASSAVMKASHLSHTHTFSTNRRVRKDQAPKHQEDKKCHLAKQSKPWSFSCSCSLAPSFARSPNFRSTKASPSTGVASPRPLVAIQSLLPPSSSSCLVLLCILSLSLPTRSTPSLSSVQPRHI